MRDIWVDLLWHLPSGIIDRRYAPKIADASPGAVATITVRVETYRPSPNRRLPYKVIWSDDTGFMSLVFFHAREDYIKKILPAGEIRVVSGTVDKFGDEIQIAHPDHVGSLDELEAMKSVEPVYPLTQGLSLKALGKAVHGALSETPDLDEWQDPDYIDRQKWESWKTALDRAHAPENDTDLEPTSANRMRLAYDELLANQLALALIRINMRRLRGKPVKGDGSLRAKIVDALPFQLTASQITSTAEIIADMASEHEAEVVELKKSPA